jgi:hypothetical protein
MRRIFLPLIAGLACGTVTAQDRDLLRVSRSEVRFTSSAPLETITAVNDRALGVLDRNDVQVPIAEFTGFNAPLQREHFNENYLVSRSWPNATFTGRIIEGIDLREHGSHEVRAKGVLTIRGEPMERVIQCSIDVDGEGVTVRARFEVPLADHGIRIPRVVQQKVAAVTLVIMELKLVP